MESTGSENATSETEAPQLYEVKYGDDVQKVTLDELISGNMMQRDYQHHKGQLNKEKEALAAEREKLNSAISELEVRVNFEANQLDSPEMIQLKEDNPTEYWSIFEKIKSDVDLLNQAKAEQASRLEAERNQTLQTERQKLLEAVPDWLDNSKLSKDWAELQAYESGFGRDINQITNHRDLVNARKAMMYDRLMSQNLEAKRDDPPPVVATPSPSIQEKETTAEQQRKERLKKTGRRQDAQAVLKDILSRS